ncbi:NlpC/P60 family protein [Pilimelia columellifera]
MKPPRQQHLHLRRSAATVLLASLALGVDSSVAVAEPTRAELQQQIASQSASLKKVTEDFNEVREEIKVSEAKIDAINKQLPALSAEVTVARGEVAEVAAKAYRGGGLQGLNMMLDDSERHTMIEKLSAMDQMARKQQTAVSTLGAAEQRHATRKQELEATLARQNAQLTEVTSRRTKIKKDLDKFYALRRKVFGKDNESGGGYQGKIPAVSGQAGKVVTFAYNAIGKPYKFADDGPSGYDCSGLTLAAWRQAGKSLPHNARMQFNKVAKIKRSELKPGDLVFYSDLGHVGLYVGSNKVIHAPTFGETVKLSSVDMMSPYGFGRVR